MNSHWIGFDLDGTLATYGQESYDPKFIGEPISDMIRILKAYLFCGQNCKIFTARVATPGGTWIEKKDALEAEEIIKIWCKKHVGLELPVTCQKDQFMSHFYDDRAIQVEPNTGKILGKIIE